MASASSSTTTQLIWMFWDVLKTKSIKLCGITLAKNGEYHSTFHERLTPYELKANASKRCTVGKTVQHVLNQPEHTSRFLHKRLQTFSLDKVRQWENCSNWFLQILLLVSVPIYWNCWWWIAVQKSKHWPLATVVFQSEVRGMGFGFLPSTATTVGGCSILNCVQREALRKIQWMRKHDAGLPPWSMKTQKKLAPYCGKIIESFSYSPWTYPPYKITLK